MRRSSSQLLHDYKPTAAKSPKKAKAVQWFVVGLGIPLLGLALLSTLDDPADPTITPLEAPGMSAAPGEPFPAEDIAASDIAVSDVPLVLAPEPEYETLELKIKSGDTLDKLFRRHQLDLGNLSSIARLEEAKAQLRRIRPGDVFEITHEDGQLISMYSVLDLTSALLVERSDTGFHATIVERPIEKRKRMAYGVIETSLYESG